MISTYFFPPKVKFGGGAVSELGKEAQTLGVKRVLIVTGKVVSKIDILTKVTSSLEEAGIEYVVFTERIPNPTNENVNDGLVCYKQSGCNLIIGLGGGSAIDCAKAIQVLVGHQGKIRDYARIRGEKKITPNLPKLIAIPTTSGTGSEVTQGAVITDLKLKAKIVIASPYLIPSLAIVDPELSYSMPPKLTAQSGMDALSHLIEGLVSKRFFPPADEMALLGIRLISENLNRVVENGDDVEGRGNMSMASLIGGLTINLKSLGLVHSLAHPLSALTGLAHGSACSLFLPYVMRFNLESAREKYARASEAMGGENAAWQAVERVEKLSSDLGMPQRLISLGIKEEDMEEMAKNALLDPNHLTNPRTISQEEMIRLLRAAL
jgi:alcohol dehydrogenase